MDCWICKELKRAFESSHCAYIDARSAAYYRVSTERAAYRNVDWNEPRPTWKSINVVCVSLAEVRAA